MHRDILRLLTFLAVVRVLVLVCSPVPITTTGYFRSSIPERRETATPRQASSHDQALVRDVTSRRPTRPAGRSDPTHSRPIRASDTAPADAPADVIGRAPQPRRAGPAPGVQEREACARAREAGRRLARGCVHRSVDRHTQYSVPETSTAAAIP